jgi:hypothetical protein
MGINLDKMREKLAALRGEGKSGDSVFWRPEDERAASFVQSATLAITAPYVISLLSYGVRV